MQLQKTRCKRCHHSWIPRVEEPLKCPRCGHARGASVRNKKAPGQARNHIPEAFGPSTHREVK